MSPRCPMQDEERFWEEIEQAKNEPESESTTTGMSRRSFMQTAAVASGASLFGIPQISKAQEKIDEVGNRPRELTVALKVNGETHTIELDTRVSLLDALRDQMKLTGSKKGCDHGQCGACTALVNGNRINSCLSLAVSHGGDDIQTIEGLARGENLHPMQASFLVHDGYQCGYCTPGQICSAVALINEAKRGDLSVVSESLASGPVPLTKNEIRERMSGNICRCGAYPNIVAAVESVAGKLA